MGKGRGRKFRRYLKGKIDERLVITSLTTLDVTVEAVDDTVVEPAWLTSVKATYALAAWTPVLNAGPIVIGVSHSDYSAAEIEEWIENSGSWNQSDLVNQEIAKRKIRQIGVFQPEVASASTVVTLADGRMITTKCGWLLSEGMTVKFWAYNSGTVDVSAATAASVNIQGHANLWPTG